MRPAGGPDRAAAAPLATPRLGALASLSRDRAPTDPSPSTSVMGECDLCAEPIGPRHGHLVDVRERTLLCACRPCSLLFVEDGAGGARYRLVPDGVRFLDDFRLDDLDWLALRIPVDLAFFFYSSAAERVVALYPGPMGATESLLSLDHWDGMEERNPALKDLHPDVEALLIDRTRDRKQGWIVPIDVCYELVALFRTHWVGLSGGSDVWDAVDEFFEDLRGRARRG